MRKRTEIFEFDKNCINTAYVLGFLWADGWLQNRNNIPSRINIEITEEDSLDVEDIFNSIGVFKFKLSRQRLNRKNQVTFAYSDINFIDFLIDNDYQDRKNKGFSKILSNFTDISIKYFIKGLFDGDGCFYYLPRNCSKQISLSSCLEQNYNGVQELLNNLEIKYTIQKVEKINSYSVLRMSSDNSCRKFIEFLGGSIYMGLNRKNIKIQKMLTPLIRKQK